MKNFKRLLCVCLIACICLCAVGCNNVNNNNLSDLSSTTTKTETSSFNNEIEKNCENLQEVFNAKPMNVRYSDLKLKELGQIIDFTTCSWGMDNHFFAITNDGCLYEISFNKPFSNDKYYKKIIVDEPHYFKKFIGAEILLDNNNNLTHFHNYEFKEPDDPINSYSGDLNHLFCCTEYYGLKYLIINNNDIIKTMNVEEGYYDFNSNEIICSIPKEETIEQVCDGGIKTNKQWYSIDTIQTNKEDCKKYADVSPKYKYELKSLNFNFNVVLYKNIGLRYIIDENNIIYTVLG